MGSEGFGVAQYVEWEVSLEELHVQKGSIPEQRGVLVGNVPVEQCGAGTAVCGAGCILGVAVCGVGRVGRTFSGSVWGRQYPR